LYNIQSFHRASSKLVLRREGGSSTHSLARCRFHGERQRGKRAEEHDKEKDHVVAAKAVPDSRSHVEYQNKIGVACSSALLLLKTRPICLILRFENNEICLNLKIEVLMNHHCGH
jgi:hypothetical protein